MNKPLSTLTAAGAGVGLALASTSAKAFFIAPALFAGLLAGGVLGGAALNSAANNSNYAGNVRTVVATPAPGVTVGSTTCYFTHAWVGNVWQRVQVCNNY
jgi:subtilisin family serine protease